MREVPGLNPIGDIAFFGGKTCSTVTQDNDQSETIILIYKRIIGGEIKMKSSGFFIEDNKHLNQNEHSTD